jgi:hypothetical protein
MKVEFESDVMGNDDHLHATITSELAKGKIKQGVASLYRVLELQL